MSYNFYSYFYNSSKLYYYIIHTHTQNIIFLSYMRIINSFKSFTSIIFINKYLNTYLPYEHIYCIYIIYPPIFLILFHSIQLSLFHIIIHFMYNSL